MARIFIFLYSRVRGNDGTKIAAMSAAALLTASLCGISLPAFAAVPMVSISNIPLTLVAPAHPQVLLAIPNSQSMDGDLSGAIMTGSGAGSAVSKLLNSSSPLCYTVPAGFTPPLAPSSTSCPTGEAPYTVDGSNNTGSSVSGTLYDNSASRLNVAKGAIQAILNTFVGDTDFGLLDYNTGGPTRYNTWLYVMSQSGGFTFSNTNTSPPTGTEYISNPCYNQASGSTVYTDCQNMETLLGANLLSMPYMLVNYSSDDPDINDVLYAGGGIDPACVVYGTVSPANPYTHYTLADYNSGGINVSYSKEINGCATSTGPTNAGFVPFQPQTMYIRRGFGYDNGAASNSGNLLLPLQTAGNNPTPSQIATVISKFTPFLAPETNSSTTTEIKAVAVQSPIAGMLSTALSYYQGNPPSSNGCTPQRYIILITDGLPTQDLSNNNWPPLGSASAQNPPNGYGVSASFDQPSTFYGGTGDGHLISTNDQALTDTINEIKALKAAGVKTYIIGVGAGVNPALNQQAAYTLEAMGFAGGTGNINGGEGYFPATSPAQVTLDMTVILTAIQNANMSVSSAAVNSTGLNTGSTAYQAQFTSADKPWQDWTGDLLAYPIEVPVTGDPPPPACPNSEVACVSKTAVWSSRPRLDSQSAASRIIATWNPVGGSSGAGAGVPFDWPTTVGSTTISSAQESELQTNSTDTFGPARLAYLRGNRSNEQQNCGAPSSSCGSFRNRSHILGDIVDSSPAYVGAPNGPYQTASYIAFEQLYASRAPVIYAGANDGMLHAFDANPGTTSSPNPNIGRELFAFIPNGVFPNLINLTVATYNQNHQYFVDGSPTAGDVQFADASWHTILTGGLNSGGNTIYALDVTNPSTITTESALASDVLWEYSDPTGNLGLTYSQPEIAYTSVAKTYSTTPFLVFFGSGYNNNNGSPYLYAVNAQTGALVAKINLCAAPGVPVGSCISTLPNGLSSPVIVNSTGALALPDDTVYAGDLQGNLWKVNISNPNPTLWTVQLLFQACSGTTCSSTNRQPITTAPVVSLHPDFPRDFGTIVYFGTGQLLGVPDLSTTSTQSFYGVWDKPGLSYTTSPALPLTRSDLQVQTISGPTVGPSGTLVRLLSNSPINWSNQEGWYMDLSISGERVVTNPRLENGAVVFDTYIPATSSCAVGGASWLLAVNYKNGGTFPSPELDLNNDGQLNSSDQVGGQNPAGVFLGNLFGAAPTIVSADLGPIKAEKLVSKSTGGISTIGQAGGSKQRASWREIPN